ncbi:CaiB/BaiF CoA transferase family protein [Sphingomonas lycopersici]|uniref:CaiB/BaiF CoA transferase family protein n=1 Tax=Sphingomonas lycopersici TaxID=2951807 RepID=UPI0022383305|nr:CoA transferase [Sphingomonas lycopersici]
MIPLLTGIRVIEISAVVLGPLAGQMLADLGAEVIKIEPPTGDVARDSWPRGKRDGALFVNNNRNKRAIALDLKHPDARPVISALIASSDVLLHNMRNSAAERLELGFEQVAAINPRIVYCAAIGFGQRGRYRDRPAFDDIIQAASGLAGLSASRGGDPQFLPTILADKVGALHAVYGVLAALVARANGRDGAIRIEVPMFEALASFVLNEHLAEATFAETGKPGYPRVLSPDRRPFRTADGWIAVLPYTGDQWRRFLEEVDRADICQSAWFVDSKSRQARIDDLYALVAEVLPGRSTADWIAALEACDVPCSKIALLDDLLADPHLADVDFFAPGPGYSDEIRRVLPQPVGFGAIEPLPDIAPRPIGCDTRAVLADCGIPGDEIEALLASGVAVAATDTVAATFQGDAI